MRKHIYTIVAVTAMLASCSQDAELNEIIDNQAQVITTIGASTCDETRAVVSTVDNKKVNWAAGDQLGVFGTNSSAEAAGPVAYTLTGEGGSTSGTFENSESTITGIEAMMSPYQSSAKWANSKLTCEIPMIQTATQGSFDPNAVIMYSLGSSADVKLNYAVNFLKVTLSSSDDFIHAITISSTDTYLSGKMEISSSGVSSAASGATKTVTLIAPGDYQCLAPGDYYIAVKAGSISNPSLSYTYLYSASYTAEVRTKTGANAITFASGTNVKTIQKPTTWDTKIWAYQLWPNGPYFADRNVGQTLAYSNGHNEYTTANVGGLYQWGGKLNRRDNTADNDNSSSGSYITGKADDTAVKVWSSAWRTATIQEMAHLVNWAANYTQITDENEKTIFTWIDGELGEGHSQIVTGCSLKGYKYARKGGSPYIFLPAAGWQNPSGNTQELGTKLYYWSSSKDYYSPYNYHVSDGIHAINDYTLSADHAFSVRAVLK